MPGLSHKDCLGIIIIIIMFIKQSWQSAATIT